MKPIETPLIRMGAQFAKSALFSRSRSETQRKLPAKFLVIDWTGTQIVVMEVSRLGTQFIAGRAFRHAFNTTDPSSRDTVSSWLGALVQKEQLHSTSVVVAAPRRFVAFKVLTLPNVHDDRLADAVAYQAEVVFPKAADELVIDYIARPYVPQAQERALLIAAIPKEHLDFIETVLVAASLQQLGVVVSELGLGGIHLDQHSDANIAIVSINASKIEYLIQAHGDPVLCYAAKAPAAESLVSEIGTTLHRLVASIPPQVLNGPLTHLHLIGRESKALQAALCRIPGITLQIEATQATEEYVKLHSIAAAYEENRCRIDFWNPRRSVDPKQLRSEQRWKLATAGVAIVTLCLLGGWLNSLRYKQQIATLQDERNRLQELIDKRRPGWEKAAAVARWQDAQVDWSEKLGQYLKALPGNDEVMLKTLELASAGDGSGSIQMEALARNSSAVQQVIDTFIDSTEFCRTQLKRLELKAGDTRYSADFALGVSVKGANEHVQ